MYSKGRILVLFVSALLVSYAVVGWMMGKVSPQSNVYRELSLFMDVYQKIQDDYVEKPDMTKTLMGALRGLTDALDPYSSFVPRESVSRVKALEQENGSIGAVMARRYGYGYVLAPLPGSPAEQAGIRAGDWIESISGRSTSDMSLAEIEGLLRGKTGSELTVSVIRGRRSQPIELKVRLEEWKQPQILARIVEERIGYLKIPYFYKTASADVRAKLKMLASRAPEGLVLDLRGTPAGSIEEAIRSAHYFLEPGKTIATLRYKDGRQEVFTSEAAPVFTAPIVILVNASSSGGAEVLAAALSDNKRATLLGERTPGAASVQKMFLLEDGSALILSVALYERPNGKALQAEQAKNAGLHPEIRVPKEDFVTRFYIDNPVETGNEKQAEEVYRKLLKAIEDLQLREGIEALKAKAGSKAAASRTQYSLRKKAA